MLIGIMSDSHNHLINLREIMSQMNKRGVEEIIHCGDVTTPKILDELDFFNIRVHLVFGNMDEDRIELEEKSKKTKNIKLYGDKAELILDQKRIVVVHKPSIAQILARTGNYDIVLFGHTHQREMKIEEHHGRKVILANPGEVFGRFGTPSYAIYDTIKNNLEFFEM